MKTGISYQKVCMENLHLLPRPFSQYLLKKLDPYKTEVSKFVICHVIHKGEKIICL